MKYLKYRIINDNFEYTFFDSFEKTNIIPLRIGNKINPNVQKIVDSIRNDIFLNYYKEILNEDISKFQYNINNGIYNEETSYYLGKMISHSLKNGETIYLSSIDEKNQEKLREIEYIVDEITSYNCCKYHDGIEKDIKRIKEYKELKYLIDEYYLPLIAFKKRA